MQNISTPDIAAPAPTGASLIAAISPQFFAATIFLLVGSATLLSCLFATGGHPVYTLDDPYIHLALAERIALGHYGINLGEVTSPSSSVIWPLLLVAGAGTWFHEYVPLAINLACGVTTAILFGHFAQNLPLGDADPTRHAKQLGIAGLLVLAGNLVGLAFTGMEHSLQVLLAAAAAHGMIEAWRGRPIPAWAIAAAMIGPAVRYEMLAVTLAMAIALAAQRRRLAACDTVLASLAAPALFAAFLVWNGNLALPNSVLAKLNAVDAETSFFSRLLMQVSVYDLGPKLVMWIMLAVTAAAAYRASGVKRFVLAGVGLAIVMHFVLGRFGWFYRYELYAIVFCGLVVLRAASDVWPKTEHLAGAVLLICAVFYLPPLINTPTASANVYEQQHQMGRFVREHYRKPFAVNDLGLVSFKLDPHIYVLDLYGLASNEAVRQRNKSPQWLDDVTRRHGAGLAIVYDEWFEEFPRSWRRVATMRLASRRITPASDHVAFFATAVGDATEIRRALAEFKAGLPPGVELELMVP